MAGLPELLAAKTRWPCPERGQTVGHRRSRVAPGRNLAQLAAFDQPASPGLCLARQYSRPACWSRGCATARRRLGMWGVLATRCLPPGIISVAAMPLRKKVAGGHRPRDRSEQSSGGRTASVFPHCLEDKQMTDAPREIEELIELMAKLPGLGPRSARRAVLYLIRKRGHAAAPAGRCDARGRGHRARMRHLRQRHHHRGLRDLHQREARDRRALRGRRRGRSLGDGARRRVQGPLPRARRHAVGARRGGAGRAAHPEAGEPGRGRGDHAR